MDLTRFQNCFLVPINDVHECAARLRIMQEEIFSLTEKELINSDDTARFCARLSAIADKLSDLPSITFTLKNTPYERTPNK
ncbi:MAG: hypothetical protein J0I84_00035 [Terrimonas sp.]|nr:hypothetical protein [Terrimonas sp.]OJY90625.1 MAG: hypothetical protein BGP13_19565 [Sphingobacteriales bacterium 40-81]